MAIQRASLRSRPGSNRRNNLARFKVGVPVSLQMGGQRVNGVVLEDRGPIGVGGRRLYRIEVSLLPQENVSFEMAEEDLQLAEAR